MDIESMAAIVFIILLSVLLYVERKRLKIEKIVFPFMYMIMYRTKLGLELMDWLAEKFRKPLKIIGHIGTVVGFLGMLLIVYSLVTNIWQMLISPTAPAAVAPVLPIKAKGVFFVPFFHWIISIFIIAVVHELMHGVMARVYNMKVKSSGFAFFAVLLPIIPAAFVEPDEKTLPKKPKRQQLAVFAAGPFANIVLAALILLITPLFFMPAGVEIVGFLNDASGVSPAELAGLTVGEQILSVNGERTSDRSVFVEQLSSLEPGDTIQLKTNQGSYDFKLGTRPSVEGSAFVGISAQEHVVSKFSGVQTPTSNWFADLFGFMFLLNLGIGLFNLVPIGPIDGGRMLLTGLEVMFSKSRAQYLWKLSSVFFLGIIILGLLFSFLR